MDPMAATALDEGTARVALRTAEALHARALNDLLDPSTSVDGEVIGAEVADGSVVVALGERYDRRTALLRRLNSLHRAGVDVSDFAWLDAVTQVDVPWLTETFEAWEAGRSREPGQAVARRRFSQLHGQTVLDHLLGLVGDPGLPERRRRTIAFAATLTGFNTHTTTAGDALVHAGAAVANRDGFAAMGLLDGAKGIAQLGRFGVRSQIAEGPVVPLVEHRDWQVHGAATELLGALEPPRGDDATSVLVRVAVRLAAGTKSTEIRAEQTIAALATAPLDRSDVDEALDLLRSHVTSAVRVSATTELARRQPTRARSLWEPWLTSRSVVERTAAESLIAAWGEDEDVGEVIRIVQRRIKPAKGTTFWPPLAAEGLSYLERHAHLPEAAAALAQICQRWDRHDDDLKRWLRLHHQDLIPPGE